MNARVSRSRFKPKLEALGDRYVPSLTTVEHGLLVLDNDAVDIKADGTTGATGVYWLADANLASASAGHAINAKSIRHST